MSLYFRAAPFKSRLPRRDLRQFYDTDRRRGARPVAGRGWSASELRIKSFSDLHKLWFVLLKEKNVLLSERLVSRQTKGETKFVAPHRLKIVCQSMARIKTVLGERRNVYNKAKDELLALYNKSVAVPAPLPKIFTGKTEYARRQKSTGQKSAMQNLEEGAYDEMDSDVDLSSISDMSDFETNDKDLKQFFSK